MQFRTELNHITIASISILPYEQVVNAGVVSNVLKPYGTDYNIFMHSYRKAPTAITEDDFEAATD